MIDWNKPIKVRFFGQDMPGRVISLDRYSSDGEDIVVLMRDTMEEHVVVCDEDGRGYCYALDEGVTVVNVNIQTT